MPKKTKEKAIENEEMVSDVDLVGRKKKKGGKGFLIFIIIFFLLCGSFLLAIVLDLFNLRTVHMNNLMAKIPFFSRFSSAEVNEPVATYEEILAQNNILISENEELTSRVTGLENNVDTYITENNRLKEFENMQIEFQATKEEFDKMVATGEPYDYIKFYEQINPDTAEEIYRELKGEEVSSEELNAYISRYKNMKPSDTAKIFEELMTTDIDLVALILENLDSDTAGEVIASMTAENGAKITKRMAP